MSKQMIGWCCVLVAVAGLYLSAQLAAQQQSDDPFGAGTVQQTQQVKQAQQASVQVEGIAQNAEQQINTALDQRLKTPMNYESEQLDIVLAALSDEYSIPIVFDKAALEEVAISSESEVTVNLRHISLHAALNLMLKEPGLEDLCYVVDEEVLLITTQEKANETLVTKVYRIDDFEHFVYDEKAAEGTKLCYSPVPLIKAIAKCVEHDSWQENGTGEGTVFRMKPGMLVVSQTRRIHRQIEDFLGKLRVVKAEIENGSSRASRY